MELLESYCNEIPYTKPLLYVVENAVHHGVSARALKVLQMRIEGEEDVDIERGSTR